MKDLLKKRSVKFVLGGALFGILMFFSAPEDGFIFNLITGITFGLIVYGIAYLCYFRRKDKKKAKLVAAEKAKQEELAKARAEKEAQAAEEERRKYEEGKKPKVYLPHVLQNTVLLYHYSNIPFTPTMEAVNIFLDKMQPTKKYELELRQEAERLFVYYDNEKFGEVNGRQDMIKDWLGRHDPLLVHVSEFGTGEGTFLLSIAFYRDEQARWSKKESDIVTLTNWKKYFKEFEECFIAHYGIDEGEMLDFEEEEENEKDVVYITDNFQNRIGKLPPKYAKRYLVEDASAVFLDHFDYDEETDNEIPVVKIYWTKQKEK